MHRNGLRLVYSGEPMKRRPAVRVYPQAATCFQCRTRFVGEDARQIVHNDGACDGCAATLDTFPQASEQGHQKKEKE